MEKMMKKKMELTEKGITLVALVVTIIVLLVLSGVTISLALGDNGIIGKAQEASNMHANARKDEMKSLNDLSDEVTRLRRRGDDGEGGSDGESQSGTPTGMKNAANNEIIYKTESATGTVTPLSTTGITTVKDNKENEFKVPKNFGIAYDSGDNVADGVVIEDTNHNQYVWIPVGTTVTRNNGGVMEAITLGRYIFDANWDRSAGAYVGTGSATLVQDSNSWQIPTNLYTNYHNCYEYPSSDPNGAQYINAKALDLETFILSANTNKGYYIARFEAGIDGDENNYDLSTEVPVDGTIKPKSRYGLALWNDISQTSASFVSQNIYQEINSDLINSYAWDTALVYIQKATQDDSYSKYSNNYWGGKTGVQNDEQCKINDMGGNVYEWTTETTDYTTYGVKIPMIVRGKPSSMRRHDGVQTNLGTYNRWSTLGFRVILYF